MLRIASIGLGDIAQKAYLPVVCNHVEITPVLCTRNTELLKALAKQYRVEECHTNLASLILAKPDAAMIHSSTESHFELAKTLIQNNIPVFIDKPISYHLQETKELITLANSKGIPLFVGFNRRYAPLLTAIKDKGFTNLRLQKNRSDIIAQARVFIMDDFIHVVDTLLSFSQSSEINNLQVQTNWRNNELAALHVQWSVDNTHFHGSMNRVCGVTEERFEAFGQLQKWQIDNLSHGSHYQSGASNQLGFNDWDSTLLKRGFVNMLDDFIVRVREQKVDPNYSQSILDTHTLCEKIIETAISQQPNKGH
ncbi:Gfo/Idh/MocA family protein [Thalassotalea marina]|uniref:Oxidoreductase n=1 Tax=Thalassotalea marina TaxID=1673741 RepID=A0A919BP60_9GAMM|nr:Gfo/Idh/MocA family oxidoreductase [Thalassotalea marina]GHG04143.1 oxidoreductase [Thalassotalea marina]